jgi:hypothetical protein
MSKWKHVRVKINEHHFMLPPPGFSSFFHRLSPHTFPKSTILWTNAHYPKRKSNVIMLEKQQIPPFYLVWHLASFPSSTIHFLSLLKNFDDNAYVCCLCLPKISRAWSDVWELEKFGCHVCFGVSHLLVEQKTKEEERMLCYWRSIKDEG